MRVSRVAVVVGEVLFPEIVFGALLEPREVSVAAEKASGYVVAQATMKNSMEEDSRTGVLIASQPVQLFEILSHLCVSRSPMDNVKTHGAVMESP